MKITKVTECKICGSQLKEAPNWREDYGRTGVLWICSKCGWSWG